MPHFCTSPPNRGAAPSLSIVIQRPLRRICARVSMFVALLLAVLGTPSTDAQALTIDRQRLQLHGLVDFSFVDGQPARISYPEQLQRDGEQPVRCALNDASPMATPAIPAIPTTRAPLSRSAWVWQSSQLLADPQRAERFFRRAAEAGIGRLFVQVHADLSGFPALFALAKTYRISLYALGGDPELVFNPAAALAIADQVIAYNATHADKFVGLQFDIEPHALPAYRIDPIGTLSRYVALIEQIRRHTDQRLPLGLAIPFWFDQKTVDGANLLTTLLGNADELVLMSYRTTINAIENISMRSLCLAQRSPTKVHLAIELAPVADEQHFISSAAQLEPFLIGDAPIAELRATPLGGLPYLQKYAVVGSNLSFYPRQDAALAMMRTSLPFSNFHGWFINGLDSVWLHE